MPRRSALIASALVAACTVQRVDVANPPAVEEDHAAHMNPADLRGPMAPDPSAQQGTPGLPASNNSAAARLSASPRHGEWVKIAWETGSSDSLMAWVVYPVARTKAPVVVVVHEIFGLSTWVRGVADQLAADGFIAIAPDFISRVRGGPSSVELSSDSARRIISGVSIPERNRAINAAASWAMMQASAEQKYAVVGYCWGGQTVWGHAVSGGVKGFSGGVAYYGGFPYSSGGQRATETTPAVPASIVADSIAKINAPVMLLNGSGDARIAASMPTIDSLMKARKKDYLGMNYEGAIHGFLRAQDDTAAGGGPSPAGAANLAATKDAWPRTIAFLKKNLGVR
ncbi:MAG TPA: dienelactone hydrolase family protein [Gemmatimonadaceae bacterium]|nr:dienelactone hydrolase family protein [Gemmatimonadaceae bacterium]